MKISSSELKLYASSVALGVTGALVTQELGTGVAAGMFGGALFADSRLSVASLLSAIACGIGSGGFFRGPLTTIVGGAATALFSTVGISVISNKTGFNLFDSFDRLARKVFREASRDQLKTLLAAGIVGGVVGGCSQGFTGALVGAGGAIAGLNGIHYLERPFMRLPIALR